jgi:hypothetical protein
VNLACHRHWSFGTLNLASCRSKNLLDLPANCLGTRVLFSNTCSDRLNICSISENNTSVGQRRMWGNSKVDLLKVGCDVEFLLY